MLVVGVGPSGGAAVLQAGLPRPPHHQRSRGQPQRQAGQLVHHWVNQVGQHNPPPPKYGHKGPPRFKVYHFF